MAGLGRRTAAVIAAVFTLWLMATPAAVAETVAFTWNDPRIPAPVGLARDPDHGVYWTVNAASASTTAGYALDPSGKVKARITLGTPARGPAAVAYDGGRLFIADATAGRNVTVSYATISAATNGNLSYRAWDFSYDSSQTTRALIVGPNTQLYVVTGSGAVYKAPPSPTARGVNRLTKVATGPSDLLGATMDGDQVVLRTATELIFCDPTSFEIRSRTPIPSQRGARGVTRSLDGQQVLISGQGIGSSVLAIGSAATPTASPTPTVESSSTPPAPTPSTEATTTAAAPEIKGETVGRTGTVVALAAAVVLAMVAGVLTFARR